MSRTRYGMKSLSVALALGVLALVAVPAAMSRQDKPAPATPPATTPARMSGKNLIIITVDTTRADHVTCYGGPKDLTPNIDALAGEGTQFLQARSQTNCTNPSHTAILTGLYAIDSKIFNNQTTLYYASPEVDTLPLAFQRAGYRTAGFPATPHLSSEILDMPGFDHYPKVPVGGGFDATQSVDNFIEWVSKPSDKPFFAWVHFFDPHMKYWPPEEYRNLFYPKDKDPYAGSEPPLGDDDNFKRSPDIVMDAKIGQFPKVRDRAYPPALYRAEIRYTDEQVGRLIKYLKSSGLYEKTGVILVADHGESLGDHDVYYDHYGMFEQCMHVPFVARMPGLPAGNKVKEPVTHVDIAPTVAALYGVKFDQHVPMHGISLAPSLSGQPNPPLAARQITVHEDAYNRQVMARKGPWKLIQMVPDAGGLKYEWPTTMLFNLDNDPQEKTNVADKNPEIRTELSAAIKPWLDLGKWNFKNPKTNDKTDAKAKEDYNPKSDGNAKPVDGSKAGTNATSGDATKEKSDRAAIEAGLKAMGYVEEEKDDKPASTTLSIGDFEERVLKKLDLSLTGEQRKKLEQAFTRAKAEVKKASAETDKNVKTEKGRKARAQASKDVADALTPEQNQKVNDAVRKRMNEKPISPKDKDKN